MDHSASKLAHYHFWWTPGGRLHICTPVCHLPKDVHYLELADDLKTYTTIAKLELKAAAN